MDIIDNTPCTTTVTVNVPFTNPALVANAGTDQTICANSSTLLSGNIPAFGNGAWTIISGAGGNIAQPTNPSSSFSGVNGTTYTLRWTVSGSPCPSANDNVQIIIRPVITPSVTIIQTGGTNPMCAGASATFTATPTNGGMNPTYQWKINGGNVGTNSTTFTTTSLTNNQVVTCVCISNAACAIPLTATSNGITMIVTPFIPLDLYIKDNTVPDDLGLEPNPDNGMMWVSPDIWTARTPFGIEQDPEYWQSGQPNYVHVTVRNRGCVDYTGGAELNMYWAKASAALAWPISWTNSPTMICGTNNNLIIGNPLSPLAFKAIPSIPAKSSITMIFDWVVPDPDPFDDCFSVQEYKHFCLLARITTTPSTLDPIGPEVPSNYTNTKEYNNIAWKNISILNDFTGIVNNEECISDRPVGGVITFGNPFDQDDVYQLDFKIDENYIGKPIFEQAEIKVILDEEAWNKWANGGYQSENIRIKREDCRQLIITGSPARLKNLSFSAHETDFLGISFNFLTDEVDNTPEFDYHIIQVRNEDNETIIGGELYRITKPSRYLFGAEGGGNKEVSLRDSIELEADGIGETAYYNWYDSDGNLLYSGQNYTVSPDFTKKYKLEVIAESDGFTSYDSVIVHVKEYEIINLSPNPASDQLTVEYEARNANSGYLNIVQPYTAVSNNYIINPALTTTRLNLSGYAPGSYFIRLVCDGQIRDEKTLIIIQ